MSGPFLGCGPCRYTRVLRPVEFVWHFLCRCKERCQPRPSYQTFLRALKEAKPRLKFRKSAGQHVNCETR
eukprot:10818298-Lingulodinium_polyedra.AAC.1